MDRFFTKWYCDACGQPIDDVKKGYVIWKTNDEARTHSYKIVHQGPCFLKDYDASAELKTFLGEEGLVRLLAQLSIGPIMRLRGNKSQCDAADMDEFVDLVRRVQTPFYEEARRHFSNRNLLAEYARANEVLPYLPEELETMIKQYGENH